MLVGLVAVGLVLRVVLVLTQRYHLRNGATKTPTAWPPVTVIRPLKGLDPDLADNLRSLFSQDYPKFQVVLGALDSHDPALAVAREVAGEFPPVSSSVVANGSQIGPNPKVANLANLYSHAQHEFIVISDANVFLPPNYLKDLMAHLQQPGVELVSSPIQGARFASLGARLNALELNTFVMGGVVAMHRLVSGVCVVGKSMAFRRSVLEEIGGFANLAQYLAEDQIFGLEIASRGYRLALARQPVYNVLGEETVGQFWKRYLRWAQIRRAINPWGFLAEPLLNPVGLALVFACAVPSSLTLSTLAVALILGSLLAFLGEKTLGIKERGVRYPLLLLLADALLLASWVVALVHRKAKWRGQAFLIGPKTRILLPPKAKERENASSAEKPPVVALAPDPLGQP
ncbi:MAG: ceramide glucosyltransferase [Thermoanaerobaculaceae bacterium]